MNLDMDRQIREIAAVADYVQGLRRSPKRLWLSFDEWNVWYRARSGAFANGERKPAPHLLEEQYNLEDAEGKPVKGEVQATVNALGQ